MLRPFLYVTIAVCATLAPELTRWSDTPPRNEFEVAVLIVACVGAAATTLRAYVDQHISNAKKEAAENVPEP